MAFKTKGQLNDHKNRHSNFRPFKCNYCQASFNRKTRLKVHIMIHTGEKPFICDYPNCGKKFRERGNLNCHYKKHFKNHENKSLPTTTVSVDNNFINFQNGNFFNENFILVDNENIICKSNQNNVDDCFDKMYDNIFNHEFFSLNELNLLCDKDEKFENNDFIMNE